MAINLSHVQIVKLSRKVYKHKRISSAFLKIECKLVTNFYYFNFSEADKCNQYKSAGTPSMCFSFQIPQDIDINAIESAQLWVSKDSSKE